MVLTKALPAAFQAIYGLGISGNDNLLHIFGSVALAREAMIFLILTSALALAILVSAIFCCFLKEWARKLMIVCSVIAMPLTAWGTFILLRMTSLIAATVMRSLFPITLVLSLLFLASVIIYEAIIIWYFTREKTIGQFKKK